MKRLGSIILILLIFNTFAFSQSNKELEAYNSYINFLNESVHGLVIAHILLVNNNKDLNRYIDLESSKTVDFGNEDLPSNIFDKPDDDSDFYEVSPIELSEICFTNSKNLKPAIANRLNSQTRNIVSILNSINRIRFDLESYMDGHDLNQKESVYGVYEYLEEVVRLFEDYASAHKQLADNIKDAYKKTTDKMYLSFYEIHNTTKMVLRNMRLENESNLSASISKMESALSGYNNMRAGYNGAPHSENFKYYTRVISEKTDKIIGLVRDYQNPGAVPYQHELYGKHYYYHNQILIHYFNWSGPGFVRDMNTLLTELKVPFILFDEEPLIFKVIYPVKVLEAKALEEKPARVENNPPPISNRLEFGERKQVDYTKGIFLEVFDHNMIDRDSISMWFNGELILDNHLLSRTPKVIAMDLDEEGQNTIEIEAKNNGIISPNTFAFSYRYKGKRKKVKGHYKLERNQKMKIILLSPD